MLEWSTGLATIDISYLVNAIRAHRHLPINDTDTTGEYMNTRHGQRPTITLELNIEADNAREMAIWQRTTDDVIDYINHFKIIVLI